MLGEIFCDVRLNGCYIKLDRICTFEFVFHGAPYHIEYDNK